MFVGVVVVRMVMVIRVVVILLFDVIVIPFDLVGNRCRSTRLCLIRLLVRSAVAAGRLGDVVMSFRGIM